jgi:hypothetical protein
MDSQIFTVLVTTLIPLVPYLLKVGEATAEEIGKSIGGEAWGTVKSIWLKLKPRMEAKPSLQEAAQGLAATPGDEDARGAFRFQLKKIFQEDPGVAAEIEQMVRNLSQSSAGLHVITAAGDRSIAGGNFNAPNFTGDISGEVKIKIER